MAPKAPGEGQKVDLGRNAPVVRETAGVVPNESLAAESYREGGEFSKNAKAQPENAFASPLRGEALASNTTTTSSDKSSSSQSQGNADSYAGVAPSYVENQFVRDSSGPHGKFVSEGSEDFDHPRAEDGTQRAMEAEPGSVMDPSRLAEQQFELKQGAAKRDAGPKQFEITNEAKFSVLEERSA